MRIRSLVTTTSIALISAGIALSGVNKAFADDSDQKPKPTASGTASVMDESQNNRQNTLEGSKSPFSLQFNLTYNGSTINHPFAKEVPNPELSVPPPLVSLSGTFSGRYRLDPSTTVGVGAGITTYQPFQGPKNTSVANPYTDLAHSWKLGVIKNRADFQVLFNTDQQTFSDLGYRVGFTALNEAFYEFSFGLTAGLLLEVDYNIFSGDPKYAALSIEQNQTQWDFIADPYFEYALNDTFNLRSVIGLQSLNNRDRSGDFDLDHPPVYQSFGVGTQIAKPFFLYTYVSGAWNNLGTDSVLFGMNAIFNIL
jgi:hypothetical protein